GSTTLLSTYACANGTFAGNEMIYEFVPAQAEHVRVVADINGGAVLVILEDDGTCPPAAAACLASSQNNPTFTAMVGHRYLIVVDAPAGQNDQFFLNVTCTPL